MSISRLPWVTLAIALTALASYALIPLHDALRIFGYTPGSLSLVRLLGCHLVHYSRTHLLWDVATFALLGAWSELHSRARFLVFLACGALLVPPIACLLTPWLSCYAGLSGLVLGLVALALGTRLAHAPGATPRWPAWTLLAALLAKQLYELHLGNTSLLAFDYQGFATVPAAHLASVLLGTCVGASAQLFSIKSSSSILSSRRLL